MNNVIISLSNNLCTGCGICEDICPVKAIQIVKEKGVYRPQINNDFCLSPKCGRCLKVCPGVGIKINSLSTLFYKDNSKQYDRYIGYYFSLYSGYSNDESIRLHGASGGIVTQFLIYLLQKKIIDGAVVTGFSKEDHITPVSYLAKTKEELLLAKSSKYCPVSLNRIGNEISQSKGKYVVVGLPCHIHGFRKRALIDKQMSERIIGYFSIYCSSNRTFYAQTYLLKKYHFLKKDISYFAYRDNGCLGNMVIQTPQKDKEIPFKYYYSYLRSFFKPRRCLTCIDHYGELADVCFGDLHIPPYSNDKIGISSWIVRNSIFNDFFIAAQKEGWITMNDLNPTVLNESQKEMLYSKKRKVRALMTLDKILNKEVVEYDIELNEKPRLKDYLSVISVMIQRFIGYHKKLWFLIDWSNFKKKI